MPPHAKYDKALFLDRDGVINKETEGYITDWSEFEFLPGALEALKKATEAGYQIIIISNQSAINRGLASKETIEEIMDNMISIVADTGGRIRELYYCPHIPEDKCECRKPEPGLFFQAAKNHGIELTNTWFVGDKLTDIAVAKRVGARPILIRGEKPVKGISVTEKDAKKVVNDLAEAIDYIIAIESLRMGGDAL